MSVFTSSNVAAWFVQIAVIVAIAGALPSLFRLHAPGVRHAYWRAVLVVCLCLPWLQGTQPVAPATTSTILRVTGADGAIPAVTPLAPALNWMSVALWIALAGAAARVIWMAAGYARLRRLQHAGDVATGCEELSDLEPIIGTRADVRFVAGLQHPVTFGAARPVVLLPASLQEQSSDIRRAVLTHELLHVQRRDWAWLLGEELLRAVFWFHPAIWWLVDRVQLSREEVVDELAVTVTGRRRAYIEALLAFADPVPLSPAPAFARRRHLFRRMILLSTEVAMSSKRIVLSGAAMALVVLSGAWYATSAFPLTSEAAAQVLGAAPGPLERRAQPITPENPVPRRISHVEPQFPPELPDDRSARVVVRLTLDESGRVAEARIERIGIPSRAGRPVDIYTPREPFGREALAAVKQWQYDPPFRGPLSFDVTLLFGDYPPPPPPPPPPAPASAVRAGSGRGSAAPPPPPPAPVKRGAEQPFEVEPEPVRVGSGLRMPEKLHDVRPVYPLIAQSARVQGVVIVEAVIEKDGSVGDVRILRSIPLLDQAALDAVRQWQFRPTLLNGVPVPIVATLTVNFRLE